MRYFMDAEFDEDGKTIELISIGIISEDDRQLYLVSKDFDRDKCDRWVKDYVVSRLPGELDPAYKHKDEIATEIIKYFAGDPDPEMWAYFGQYDWVAFCQIFGKMINLPKGLPKYCYDLKQLRRQKGYPPVPKQTTTEHIAINDAAYNRDIYNFLRPLPYVANF